MRVEFRALAGPAVIGLLFWTLGYWLSYVKGTWFYVFDLGYIGTSIVVGLGLYRIMPRAKKVAA